MADDALLEEIRRNYRKAVDATSESRLSQLDDQRFAAGSPDNKWQWDDLALATRAVSGTSQRPTLTINLLLQHVRQVTNEQRENRPAIKVLPVDDKADPETAKVFNGIIRHIQVASDADIAYDTACESQVTHGEGFFRIVAEYCDADSFDQDLRIKRIRDPFSVRMDPMIQSPTGEDARFCFIESEMTRDEFKAEFPGASELSWSSTDPNITQWIRNDNIVVAEYYKREMVKKTVCLWPDGSTSIKGEKDEIYAGLTPVKERTAVVPKVTWRKTNGFEILGEEKDVPGKFIPVFRVVGNEWVVEGDVVVSGIVRNAKDPQRMVNYLTSQEAEMLALAPKAPFVGAAGQFEDFEGKWGNANVINYPYLEYNPVSLDGTLAPKPERMAPPMASQGIIEAKMQAVDAVKQATGQYDASLGARSNETSGRAILARQKEGDVGTYHFVDNLDRALRSAGRYFVDTIPVYYDRKRVARIIGEDGEPSNATIDPNLPTSYEKQETETGIEEIYNPSVGKYDVVSTVGPGYTTKRQEAAEFMAQVLQGNKELMAVMGDLYFGMLDVPGADEIAERLKKTIDPKLLEDDKGKTDPRVQQMGQVIDQLTQEVHELSAALESADTKIKVYDAHTKRITALKDMIPADLAPELVLDSGILTPEHIEDAGARGGFQPPPQPEQPPEQPGVQ